MPRVFEMIVDERCLFHPEKDKDGDFYFFKLTDTLPGEKSSYSVYLTNVPQNSIAVKTDMFDLRSIDKEDKNRTFLSDNIQGLRKRADFMIVSEEHGSRKILILELTAGRSKGREMIIHQLKGTRSLLDYCNSLVEQFLPLERLLKETLVRYAAISPRVQGQKAKIGYSRNNRNKTPETYLPIRFALNSRIDYRYLVP